MSLAIWDHTVLPVIRHKWTHPAVTPAYIGRYSIYLPLRDGRLSWPRWLVTYRDGLPANKLSPIQVLTNQCKGKGKGKGRYSSSWESHVRATGRHLPYGITVITQCYLPPDTSERAAPNSSHPGWYSIYLPWRDGKLSWPRWPLHTEMVYRPTDGHQSKY